MAKKSKSKKNNALFSLAVVALVFAVVSILSAFRAFEKFEYKFYDLLLGLKKEPQERSEIMLVDIDDLALDQMGNWPWTRDKIADSLLYMRELGAETAVFDIEYLSSSQKSVDSLLYQKILADGTANADEIQNLFVNNDEYFARSLQFFGNSWLTVNSGNLAIDYSDDELSYAKKRFLLTAEDEKHALEKFALKKDYSEFSPAMFDFISRAKGAGFTNVKIDSDGTRRRIPLFVKYDDGVLAQLSLAPLLKILSPEKIKITKHYIILENVNFPELDSESVNDKDIQRKNYTDRKRTIKIPVGRDGTMLINWLKKPYAAIKTVIYDDGTSEEVIDEKNTSFNHCSMFYLWNLCQLEKEIVKELKNASYFEFDIESENNKNESSLVSKDLITAQIQSLLADYSDIIEYKNYIFSAMNGYDADGNAIGGGVGEETFAEYFSLRQSFFENLAYFVQDLENEIHFELDSESEIESFRNTLDTFLAYYSAMQEMFEGKLCIIGNTGSGTTDLGSTPFQNSYPNVGTHANVYNTIMSGSFITPISWFWAAIVAAVLSFFAFGFHSSRKVWVQSAIAVLLLAVVVCIPMALMHFANIYVPLTMPVLITVLSYILITAFRFRSSEKDKKFITGAFSQCLSKDVVQEIIKDPSKLVLGGKTFEMTALFTDIQKFSGFSELLSAEELVALLNYYLTKMSEIIIDEHGTVDKFEGDAIVAFTGAPVPMADHAERACSAAIKMKKSELQMNSEIAEIAALDEKPDQISEALFSAFKIMIANKRTIFTRIGLNSGEIVAGFMGSDNKKNYTVMGNNVNLASRLEGVNKQYSTGGILISAATRSQLDEKFIVRSLDRVQVVNVKTPIRLYELLGFKTDFSAEDLTCVENWENAIKLFEKRNFEKSLELFKNISSRNKNDLVAKYYISLLENFFVKGKFPTVQDGIGVSYNAENPADMPEEWLGTEKEIRGTFTLLQK